MTLGTETDTLEFGADLFNAVQKGSLIFLYGDLGAGKTTLVRGYLRAAGYQGAVKSPTYTLVEEYFIGGRRIYHFDLYRLGDPEELEWMGVRDYLSGEAICLVEWPERGAGVLPQPDLRIRIATAGLGRTVQVEFFGDVGLAIADRLK
ncbi:MAG: tRNA (adenosine(37)-N6)-threonylcarbamoyltransferase complex ATPase subunit type 1 TsaE [Pseudomonadota bacterium]